MNTIGKEMKTAKANISDQMEGVVQSVDEEKARLAQIARIVSDRMDELDAMYEDMQDRVFEIDKNRKNNLVFYGVKPHTIAGYQSR